MNIVIRKILKFFIDPRIIVGLGGVILSIVLHEIFHAIIHWDEIERIGIFPDRHAIVEIIFQPSEVYNLAVEEGIAYTVTMATLILTAVAVYDINEAKDTRTVRQILYSKDTDKRRSKSQNKKSNDHLAHILGIKNTTPKLPIKAKRKP